MTDNERNKSPYYDYSKPRNQYFHRGQMEWDKNHFLQRILEILIKQQKQQTKECPMKKEAFNKPSFLVNNGLRISLEGCNNSIHTCCVFLTNLVTGDIIDHKFFDDIEKAVTYMNRFSNLSNQPTKEAKMPFTPADDKKTETPIKKEPPKDETQIEPDNDFHIQSYLDGKKVGKDEGSRQTDLYHQCYKIRNSLDSAIVATQQIVEQKIKRNEWVPSYWYEMIVILRKAHDLCCDKAQPAELKGGAYVGINKKKGPEGLS